MSVVLLLASANRGKLVELRELLPGVPLVGLRDVGIDDLEEPGEDYLTNAVAKAQTASKHTGMVALADDSGLEVDGLGGAPGWRSARFGGGHGDDKANRARLKAALEGRTGAARRARFRCALAVADARGPLGPRVLSALGACVGEVLEQERGENGFGYDPLLRIEGRAETMAELASAEKHRLSHRGQALRALEPALLGYLRLRGACSSLEGSVATDPRFGAASWPMSVRKHTYLLAQKDSLHGEGASDEELAKALREAWTVALASRTEGEEGTTPVDGVSLWIDAQGKLHARVILGAVAHPVMAGPLVEAARKAWASELTAD